MGNETVAWSWGSGFCTKPPNAKPVAGFCSGTNGFVGSCIGVPNPKAGFGASLLLAKENAGGAATGFDATPEPNPVGKVDVGGLPKALPPNVGLATLKVGWTVGALLAVEDPGFDEGAALSTGVADRSDGELGFSASSSPSSWASSASSSPCGLSDGDSGSTSTS